MSDARPESLIGRSAVESPCEAELDGVPDEEKQRQRLGSGSLGACERNYLVRSLCHCRRGFAYPKYARHIGPDKKWIVGSARESYRQV